MLAIVPLETWRFGLARRGWLKPLKQLYNTKKTTPISESRRGLVTLLATWLEALKGSR